MSELYERLKLARKLKGYTQEQLSNRVNISRGAISQYESNNVETRTTPTAANLKKLAAALDVTLSWLADDDSRVEELAGTYTASRTPGADITFSDQWLSNFTDRPADVIQCVISGRDLAPRIQDGDTVLIAPCTPDEIENGHIYAIEVADRVILRRATVGLEGVVLVDNHDTKDVLTPAKMRKLKLVGRVFWVGKEL